MKATRRIALVAHDERKADHRSSKMKEEPGTATLEIFSDYI